MLDFFASFEDHIGVFLKYGAERYSNEQIVNIIKTFINKYGHSDIFKKVFKDSGAFKKMFSLYILAGLELPGEFEKYIESRTVMQLVLFLEEFATTHADAKSRRELTRLFAKHFASCSENEEYAEKVIIFNEFKRTKPSLIYKNTDDALENTDKIKSFFSDSDISEAVIENIQEGWCNTIQNFCICYYVNEDEYSC